LKNLQNAVFSRFSALLKSLSPADKQYFYRHSLPPKPHQIASVCQAAEASVILQKIGPNDKVAQSVANLGRES